MTVRELKELCEKLAADDPGNLDNLVVINCDRGFSNGTDISITGPVKQDLYGRRVSKTSKHIFNEGGQTLIVEV